MKILVIRTDRIGEVLLSTPILTALKEKWPLAEITVMIKPEVKELLEGNPNVNEIIEYAHSCRGHLNVPYSIATAIKIAMDLKKKQFDIAVVVNPKKEFHLAVFLAGIPLRVGFNRKWGFLLTHKVNDLKFLAAKHEVEYNLDLVRALGIEPKDKRPYLKVTDNARHNSRERIRRQIPPGSDSCRLVAIHPCTSNPKKQWPKEYFARLGDLLMLEGYNVAMVSGAKEARLAEEVIALMKNKPIDLSGKLCLKELAALFEECKFLISGDSGPVHIASAVGTRVIALFGSTEPGSRPKRWGPYGEGHIVIEKERLEDIKPEEVLKNAHTYN